MDIIQRIKENQLMDDNFDIFVTEDSGGFMTDFRKERFDTIYKPYLPPICFEQEFMKKLVQKCMNILRASHNESEICSQMLCGCVEACLEQYKTDICNIVPIDDDDDDDDDDNEYSDDNE